MTLAPSLGCEERPGSLPRKMPAGESLGGRIGRRIQVGTIEAQRVDAAMNMYGKPYSTAGTIHSLLKQSHEHISNLVVEEWTQKHRDRGIIGREKRLARQILDDL